MQNNSNHLYTPFRKSYGPWAVVAGASEGLGAAYAEALAKRGLDLILVARRLGLMQALAARLTAQYGISIRTITIDLSQPSAAAQIAKESESVEVGLLVYNAAFSAVGPFFEHSLDDHLREVDTNMRTLLALVHSFGERMLAAGHGGIILMASLSAFQGSAYISTYGATKAFNIVLAEGLWEEWRRRGVDVLACIAGAIRTPNYQASSPSRSGSIQDATLEPEFVAAKALAALGHQPTVIPGRLNSLSSFVMRRVLSRQAVIRIMGNVLRGMYVDKEPNRSEAKE